MGSRDHQLSVSVGWSSGSLIQDILHSCALKSTGTSQARSSDFQTAGHVSFASSRVPKLFLPWESFQMLFPLVLITVFINYHSYSNKYL